MKCYIKSEGIRNVNVEKITLLQKKYIKTVISLALSVININLVVSLEEWTQSAPRIAVALFGGVGAVLFYLLIDRFMRRQERRLKLHALLWGRL